MVEIEIKTGGAAFCDPFTGEASEFDEAIECKRLLEGICRELEDGARWRIYKANIYGYYNDNDLPVKSGELNWSKNLNFKLNRIDISAYEREVG